jgi:hypothetical protein
LGIKNQEELNVDDPCSDELYNYFRGTAKTNALIYEEVFNTIPTNHIRVFSSVSDYVERPKLKLTDPLAVSFISFLLKQILYLSKKRLMKNVNKSKVLLLNFPWNLQLMMF